MATNKYRLVRRDRSGQEQKWFIETKDSVSGMWTPITNSWSTDRDAVLVYLNKLRHPVEVETKYTVEDE